MIPHDDGETISRCTVFFEYFRFSIIQCVVCCYSCCSFNENFSPQVAHQYKMSSPVAPMPPTPPNTLENNALRESNPPAFVNLSNNSYGGSLGTVPPPNTPSSGPGISEKGSPSLLARLEALEKSGPRSPQDPCNAVGKFEE